MRAALLLLLPAALAATELNCGAPSTAYDMTNSTSLGSLLDLRDAFCGALLRDSRHSGPMNWTDVTADGGVWRGWRATYTLGGEVRRGGSGVGKWRHGMGHGMGYGMGRRPGRGPGRGGRGRKGRWRDDDDEDGDGDDEDDDETGGDDDEEEDGDDEDGDDGDGDDEDGDDGEDENAETLKLGRRAESTKAESTSTAESSQAKSSTKTESTTKAESTTSAKSTTKAKSSTTPKTGTTTKPTKTDTKAEKTSSSGSKPSTSPTSSTSKSSPTDKHKPVKVMFIADQENADASACRRAFLEIVQGCMLGVVKPSAKNAGSAVWKEGNDRYGISFSQ